MKFDIAVITDDIVAVGQVDWHDFVIMSFADCKNNRSFYKSLVILLLMNAGGELLSE